VSKTEKPLDRFDLALLLLCSDSRHEFSKNARMERRLYDLSLRGFVERKMQPFKRDFGKGTLEVRYGYRRTETGKAAVDARPSGGAS